MSASRANHYPRMASSQHDINVGLAACIIALVALLSILAIFAWSVINTLTNRIDAQAHTIRSLQSDIAPTRPRYKRFVLNEPLLLEQVESWCQGATCKDGLVLPDQNNKGMVTYTIGPTAICDITFEVPAGYIVARHLEGDMRLEIQFSPTTVASPWSCFGPTIFFSQRGWEVFVANNH